MKVAVIGAGISGLTIANLLSRNGNSVKVYDSAKNLEPVGAGFTLQPQGISVLEKLGLLSQVAICSAKIGTSSIYDPDGKGIAQAVRYANERSVWGSPIGSHQGLSHPLAKSKVEVELARLMTQKAAQSTDNGEPSAAYANYAKYAAAEAAIGAIDNAIQTHGGNGFTKEYGISDLYWPARLFRTAPVSAEMILNYVSQNVLGLPKSY